MGAEAKLGSPTGMAPEVREALNEAILDRAMMPPQAEVALKGGELLVALDPPAKSV